MTANAAAAGPLNAARLCVFAKAPVAGRVKTRLARSLGGRGAAAAYRRMLAERLASLAVARIAPLELWVAPGRHPWLTALARRYGAALRVQPRGDLGARMLAALDRTHPVVVIGGDCPGLATAAIGRAVGALTAGAHTVISPAEDGGYTLIGVGSRPERRLFRHMPWGTPRVMAETRRRAWCAGVALYELPPSWDVDDRRDWRRWRRHGSSGNR